MKVILLICILLFAVVAETNKKHSVHKKAHLKRDGSGNNTDSGYPTIYEPIVPLINQVNSDRQEVNPFSAVISWLTKKHGDSSRNHHIKRNGNITWTNGTGQSNTTITSWFTVTLGNTTQPYNSSTTHI